MNKCRICKVRDATKKNSHQLPSFLGAMISSNGDYRRGKELMFTFNKYQSGVYAYGLDSTKWEEIFDGLTDKRIRQISVNPISEDYVFCPQCEKMLGEYLESPYSVFFKEGGSIAPDIPLMFWVSVVWRLSTQGTNGFNLGIELNERLRKILNTYLQCKNSGEDVLGLVENTDIFYRIVGCKDFCKTNAGYFHCRYDAQNKFLAIIVGDVCVCINLAGEEIPPSFSLYGIENYIRNAPINNGQTMEQRIEIAERDYKCVVSNFVKHAAQIKKQGLFEIADELWKLRFCGLMPLSKKYAFAEKVVSADVKLGDRYSPEIILKSFEEVAFDPLI